MSTYTGPVPPTPTPSSPDSAWQSWWSYQNLLRDLRYEDYRAARDLVNDRQHAEKMAAEAGCQAAQHEMAVAQQAHADAIRYMTDHPEARQPTDADLVSAWTQGALAAGVIGFAAVDAAKKALAIYRLTYKAPAK